MNPPDRAPRAASEGKPANRGAFFARIIGATVCALLSACVASSPEPAAVAAPDAAPVQSALEDTAAAAERLARERAIVAEHSDPWAYTQDGPVLLQGSGRRVGRLGMPYGGHIHAAAVDHFTAIEVTPGEMVTIGSPGGEIEAAIRMAEWMRANNLGLYVRTECGSACAQFLLVAASQVIVEPGAFVWCHGNNLSNALATSRWRPLTARERDLKERAERLYADVGVSLQFAYDCGAAVEPMCFIDRYDGVSDESADLSILRSRAPGWIPPPDVLSAYGVRGSGYPATESDIRNHAWYFNRDKALFRWGPPPERAREMQENLVPCDEAPVAE